jgi:hypothetical protein
MSLNNSCISCWNYQAIVLVPLSCFIFDKYLIISCISVYKPFSIKVTMPEFITVNFRPQSNLIDSLPELDKKHLIGLANAMGIEVPVHIFTGDNIHEVAYDLSLRKALYETTIPFVPIRKPDGVYNKAALDMVGLSVVEDGEKQSAAWITGHALIVSDRQYEIAQNIVIDGANDILLRRLGLSLIFDR